MRSFQLFQLETYVKQMTYMHSYHSRFIPQGVAEASRIFLRDAHFLPKLIYYEE
jgi:hypothetical protein